MACLIWQKYFYCHCHLFVYFIRLLVQVANGEQRFIMRHTGSGEVTKEREPQGFREYKFSLSCGEEGWDKVELTKDMLEDLEINQEFRNEVDTGKKIVIGRL